MKFLFNKKNLVLAVALGILVWVFMKGDMPYDGSIVPDYSSESEIKEDVSVYEDEKEADETEEPEIIVEPELQLVPCDEQKLYDVTKVTIQQAEASSYLISNSGIHYSVDCSYDGKLSTSWQDGESGYGEDSTLRYSWGENKVLRYLCIYPGSGESKDKFYQNGRPKGITIIVGDKEYALEFEDKPEYQMIEVSGEIICDEITLVINSVYEGSKYEDTCLAEVEIFVD